MIFATIKEQIRRVLTRLSKYYDTNLVFLLI